MTYPLSTAVSKVDASLGDWMTKDDLDIKHKSLH